MPRGLATYNEAFHEILFNGNYVLSMLHKMCILIVVYFHKSVP